RPPPSAGSSSAPCVRRGTTRAPSRPRDPTPRTGTTARGRKWAMNGQEAAPPVAIVGLDEDMVFQHREWRWQRVGRVAVAVFVLAACLGLLGGAGPFNRTEARADDDSLIVEYDRVIRAGTPTTVQLNAAAAADYCLISPALFDALDIERI